jgi:hypothetical protein
VDIRDGESHDARNGGVDSLIGEQQPGRLIMCAKLSVFGIGNLLGFEKQRAYSIFLIKFHCTVFEWLRLNS